MAQRGGGINRRVLIKLTVSNKIIGLTDGLGPEGILYVLSIRGQRGKRQ